jgi:HlyD family secretion protein
MNKKIPWIVAGVLAVVLIGGGTWYYKSKNTTTAPSYLFGEVKKGTVAKKINATGTIQYPTQYNLTFDGKARLTKVNVAVGDSVKAGQVLAEVDSAGANQQVLQAKASLTGAKIKLNQLKAGASQVTVIGAQNTLADAKTKLDKAQQDLNNAKAGSDASLIQQAQESFDSTQRNYNLAKAKMDELNAGTSSTDIQSAQLQVEQAQASLATAQAALDQTKLVAPSDGLITTVNGKVGEYPGSSSSTSGSGSGSSAFIVLMGASSTMQIVVPADEADIGNVKVDQTVDITLSAFPDKKFSGIVAHVAPAGKTQNNVTTFDVTISADNTDNLMKVGMSANVAIMIEQKQNVLMVPSEAVRGRGTSKTVLLAPAQGVKQPTSQDVQIGLDDGINAEVISGLEEGRQVITGVRAQKATTTTTTNPFSSGGASNRGSFGGMSGGGGANRGGGQ